MLRTFIQVLALALTLVASVFLLKSNLGLSVTSMAELSKTKWGYNTQIVQNLAHQQADTSAGLFFLLLAFGLQIGNLLWPMRWDDFEVNKKGVALAVVVSILFYLVGWYVAHAKGVRSWKEAVSVLEKHRAN